MNQYLLHKNTQMSGGTGLALGELELIRHYSERQKYRVVDLPRVFVVSEWSVLLDPSRNL